MRKKVYIGDLSVKGFSPNWTSDLAEIFTEGRGPRSKITCKTREKVTGPISRKKIKTEKRCPIVTFEVLNPTWLETKTWKVSDNLSD